MIVTPPRQLFLNKFYIYIFNISSKSYYKTYYNIINLIKEKKNSNFFAEVDRRRIEMALVSKARL